MSKMAISEHHYVVLRVKVLEVTRTMLVYYVLMINSVDIIVSVVFSYLIGDLHVKEKISS